MKKVLRRMLLRCLPVLVLLLLPHLSDAARITPLEGLEIARKGMVGMKDFTAEITQEKQITLLKKKLVSTGTVRFRRPDSFFMEIAPPNASRMLIKDNVFTMYLPAENVRQKTVLPAAEGLLHWFTMLDKPVASVPEGVGIQAERAGKSVVLTISPKGKKGVSRLQITLHEDGRPQRLVIEEQNRDRTVMSFRNVRKNVGLSDKDFRIE